MSTNKGNVRGDDKVCYLNPQNSDKEVEMEELVLRVPCKEELTYRQKILADPPTMTYNKAMKDCDGDYNPKTGCIDFHEGLWDEWYERWVDKVPDRFYAYLYDKTLRRHVGEVALRSVENPRSYMCSIVVEDKYRGFGYGRAGLKLLVNHAFEFLDAEELIDHLPAGRKAAHKLFTTSGFIIKEVKGEFLVYGLKKSSL